MPTTLSMGAEIRLPMLELVPWGLFTDVVPEIDLAVQGTDRTALGGKWVTRDAYTVDLDTYTCAADDDINDDVITLEPGRETLPFMQHQMISCSTVWVNMDWLNDWLADDARMTRSAALVKAVTTAITANHLNFVDDATALAGSNSMAKGIALVEDALSERILNGRGYIFVPPILLAHAMNDGIFVSNGELVSPRGHRVICDAGHQDTTLYGTGAMGWSITEAQRISGDLGVFEFSDNTQYGAYTRYGVVFFNPAHTVKNAITIS